VRAAASCVCRLRFSVSHTTRRPRANEQDGREYHFVDRATFEQMVREGAFVEWASVHGNLYGTSMAEIDAARRTTTAALRRRLPGGAANPGPCAHAVTVFILPPSLQELERRLRNRASDDEQTIVQRLANARGEIEHYGLFDYVVVNDDIDEASEQLKGIVLAERCRRWRRAMLAERMLAEAQGRR